MSVFSSNDDCVRKEANVLVGHDELKAGAHVGQLHREIFALHGNRENPFQVIDRTIATESEQRDFPAFNVGWCKKGKSLDMVPVKVGKGDDDRLLSEEGILHQIAAEMPYSRPGVDDANIHRVIVSDQGATRTPTILIELSSVHRN